MLCTDCYGPLGPDDIFCGNCGAPRSAAQTAAQTVAQSAARSAPRSAAPDQVAQTAVEIHHVSGSQVAVGDGNVQIKLSVEGASRFGERDGGIELRPREIPVPAIASRADPIGRDALIERVCQDLWRGITVQLFGAAGVGRSAVAEAVLRRQAAARVRAVQVLPGNRPHTLESLYARLVEAFFGVTWYEPEEAVLRMEVAKADLSALIMVLDCDLDSGDLERLLGTFPGCTFLLTSRRQTLPEAAGMAYEVDPLTSDQAQDLITRSLGGDPSWSQSLQWEEAYRLAGGQVQRFIEHVAFIKRAATRPGQTELLNVPVQEQVAILLAGLSEPARRAAVALSTYRLTLTPRVFGAVTGLPEAAGSAAELITAGVVTEEGQAFRIAPDAAEVLASAGELTDPSVAADGLMTLLAEPDPPDPHLVLSVARALHEAGDDARTTRLTRAGAPRALAAGEIAIWASLVALGFQAATGSRRKADLIFFLNEQHTGALLQGDKIAAAAALAALGDLLAEQQAPAAATAAHEAAGHSGLQHAAQSSRPVRQARRGLFTAHHVIPVAAGAAAIAIGATIAVAATAGGSAGPSLPGTWAGSGGSTFTFASAGTDTYVAAYVPTGAPQCSVSDDARVTGSNGHYNGTIQLHQIGGTPDAQGCEPQNGTAAITINVAANNDSARVDIVNESSISCQDCDLQTWTRKS